MKQLEKLKTWKKELALAETFEEVKTHESAAAAAAEFAKRNQFALDKQNEIGKFRIDIERKKGAWLDENYPQGKHKGNQYTIGKVEQLNLSKMPVTKNESSNARLINREEELSNQVMDEIEQKGEVITPNKVQSEIRKIIKKEELKQIRIDIEKGVKKVDINNIPEKFDIIYADPPWRYDFAETSNRKIENQYTTMDNNDIANMKVPAKDNCVLFMWATAPKLIEALDVMKAWGFTYKTHAVWDKQKIGMGYWFRGQHELLMVGVKGKFSPPDSTIRISSVIKEERSQHSKKPDSIADYIDLAYYNKSKIELFCREPRSGWYSFGNQI
tara:strand:+ start:925 stop:1908 length:984 start_codon:yes stop_codon:yes gene_type:complete